ncbi:MAG: DUF4976 domain-containing protein, partial [Chitinispirillaceae bacterium]|nr:DUF4976 domain-containing protein [Chitinispirillaceae bacterium]
ILDIAGVTPPADMQGKSFKPILQGRRPANWRNYFYYHYYEMVLNTHNAYRHYAVTDGRYKLMYFWDVAEYEFYDLQNDPGEMVNQYFIPQYASVISLLKQKMDSLRTALQVPPDTLLSPKPAIAEPARKTARAVDIRYSGFGLTYTIPAASPAVNIMIVDLKGVAVRAVVDGPKQAGTYRIRLPGKTLPPGMYICVMTWTGYSKSIPLTVDQH